MGAEEAILARLTYVVQAGLVCKIQSICQEENAFGPTGWFFVYCSALKVPAPQGNLRTVPPKKRLKKKKVKVPKLFLPYSRNSTNFFSENLLKFDT